MGRKKLKIKKELHSLWFMPSVWEKIEKVSAELGTSYSGYIASLVNKQRRKLTRDRANKNSE